MKKKNKLYEVEQLNNFRELLERATTRYADKVAYKFKVNLGKKNQKIEERTYSQIKTEVENLATKLLNMGFENRKFKMGIY